MTPPAPSSDQPRQQQQPAGSADSIDGCSSSVGSLPGGDRLVALNDSAGEASADAYFTASAAAPVYHRTVSPTDLPKCFAIESSSYPSDEAASLESLQYRQHHAANYFRCAVLVPDAGTGSSPTDSQKMAGEIVGFVTGTRCSDFDVSSMTVHDPAGPLLAIHSVVVAEPFRRRGIGGKMLREYVQAVRRMSLNCPVEKIVLMAKADKLAFYVRAGFSVVGVSPIVHGRDTWYECLFDLTGGSGLQLRPSASRANSFTSLGTAAAEDQHHQQSSGDSSAGGSASGSTGVKRSDSTLSQSQSEHDAGKKNGAGGSDDTGSAAGVVNASADGWRKLTDSSNAAGRPCFVVDSFADLDRPGSGNPAGVVYMGEAGSVESVGEREEAWMRTVAMEFSLSETAFLWDRRRGDGASSALWRGDEVAYDIRYYTKGGNEVDLCGHATLAAASAVLRVAAEDKSRPTEVKKAVFYAKKDVLKASVAEEPSNSGSASLSSQSSAQPPNMRIVLNFPWRSIREIDAPADFDAIAVMLEEAFGIGKETPLYVGMDSVGEDLLIELSQDDFDSVGPVESSLVNVAALGTWGGGYTRGVILCCRVAKESKDEKEGIDFISRFFGPKAGIDEDPVTGSAHCTLGPYFAAKIGRSRVVGRQASSRGGIVECVLTDGGGVGEGRPRRVSIAGTAVTTISGSLYI